MFAVRRKVLVEKFFPLRLQVVHSIYRALANATRFDKFLDIGRNKTNQLAKFNVRNPLRLYPIIERARSNLKALNHVVFAKQRIVMHDTANAVSKRDAPT